MKTSLLLLLTLCLARPLFAADPNAKAVAEPGEKLVFHTDWKGERITLPPGFAPAMKLKGIEEIRFAPGMFQAQSASFFSYAFVFSVSKEQELTQEVIQQEILAYYRGLSEAVSKGKGRTVETGKFTFKLERAKQAADAPEQIPATTTVTQYAGELDWIEPFATGKAQLLHFEIQSWSVASTARNYLFVCTSPKAPGESEPIWKDLRKLRRSFEFPGKPAN